jgi:3-amino-4-hydroxybenzoic acid synthase
MGKKAEQPTSSAPTSSARVAWLDLRSAAADHRMSLVEAAVHHRLDGIVADDPELLGALPPTVARVAVASRPELLERLVESADILLVPPELVDRAVGLEEGRAVQVGTVVDVRDAAGVEQACQAARSERWTLMRFADPTKIPLEIVLAASDGVSGHTVSVVGDLAEAEVVAAVLEKGPHGVALVTADPDDVERLSALRRSSTPPLALEELEVRTLRDLGVGDRACVDTCSLFAPDEGLLIGSFSRGLLLACSETHPLPYMPTRPFRVNAGAVHSYVLRDPTRTAYLSELHSGQTVLGVDVHGATRPLVVGRVKIERRPLIGVNVGTLEGDEFGIVAQNDWHVRMLGPDGRVHNITELRPGDRLLGYRLTAQRHVGLPMSEFCQEQ